MCKGFYGMSKVNVIIGIIWIWVAVGLNAQNSISIFRADSLRQRLAQLQTPQDKLPLLKELVGLYWQLPEEVSSLKEVIKIAMPLDSITVVYDAMAGLSRYYYNEENRDSLLYWVNQLDSLATSRDENPDGLFLAGSLICQDYLWAGNYELAMDKAFQCLDRAQKAGNEYGLMRAYRDLGMVYQRINRDSDAVDILRKGLPLLKRENSKSTFLTMYLSSMLRSTLVIGLLPESEELLKQYDSLLDSLEIKYEKDGKIFPIRRHRCLINCYYSELYTMKGDMAKARAYLDKATAFRDSTFGTELEAQYLRTKSFYYWKTNDSKRALRNVEQALKINRDLDKLEMKKAILQSSGQLEEVIAVYEEIIEKTEMINTEAFNRQMEQLRVLNNLNGMEKQDRELKLKSEQERLKQRQVVVALVFLVAIMVLLYVLWRIYCRTRKLRNELLQEKDSLIESEKQLRAVARAAEEANRKKSAFIANISHEVRTPLNAIVGFSELLASSAYGEKENVEFAGLVNHNSELLLNLINDVLDLSRFESGKIQFAIKPNDLVACCQRSMDSIRHRIKPGVKLTFTPSHDPYTLNTDVLRLRQLLTNLLSNAVKFTSSGEINLSFTVDEKKEEVLISVTDTGCGIPIDKHEQIFERFEKLDEFIQGTGLGLSVCQIIAEQLNGSLVVDSSYTKGARFIFIHPTNLTQTCICD